MLESSTAAKKPFSNKAVIAVLLLCGLLTTIAVFASAACYCYKKDKLSVQTITTLSDKETSWNSRINLMSDQSGSFQGFPVKSPIIGKIISMCISYSFFFFFSWTDTNSKIFNKNLYSDLPQQVFSAGRHGWEVKKELYQAQSRNFLMWN